MISFKNLNLINPIIRAVTEAGYSRPTEIQSFAIPNILAGNNVIGCSPADSGKTAAFALPILQLLKKFPQEHSQIRILILTPTSELVMEMEKSLGIYSKYLPLSQLSVFGDTSAGSQLAALRKRVDILVATPERLLELTGQRHIDLSKIEILVLDEGDRMLEMGFAEEVEKILKLIPPKRQSLFFSAAMHGRIRKFADAVADKPGHMAISDFQQPAFQKAYAS